MNIHPRWLVHYSRQISCPVGALASIVPKTDAAYAIADIFGRLIESEDNLRISLYIYNIDMPKATKVASEENLAGEIEEVLNGFGEVMSKVMIDHHQEQIAALDLTLLQGQVLRVLRRGAVTTGKLASELQISASAVTQLTDRLIRKELIERQPTTGDRRCVVIGLSRKGKGLIDDFRKRRRGLLSEALSQLSEPEQAQVIQAMKLVIRAFGSSDTNRTIEQTRGE